MASVSPKTPRFKLAAGAAASVASAGRLIESAMRADKSDPLAALGKLLEAALAASDELARNPADAAARNTYNFAVARTVDILQTSGLCPWKAPICIPGGEFVLTFKADPRPSWNPDLYRFVPADQFNMRGSFVSERSIKEGVGAPLVAIGND